MKNSESQLKKMLGWPSVYVAILDDAEILGANNDVCLRFVLHFYVNTFNNCVKSTNKELSLKNEWERQAQTVGYCFFISKVSLRYLLFYP